jgi:hypothetical protein
MEVTVAMLIASIVIGITYTVYNIVSKSYCVYNTKNKGLAQLTRLDELLKNDFEHAETISEKQDGLLFKNQDKLISYNISPEYIVRISTSTDTFKIKSRAFNTYFEKKQLTKIDNDEMPDKIDELELGLLFERENILYHYYKHYSAADLMQTQDDAIN